MTREEAPNREQDKGPNKKTKRIRLTIHKKTIRVIKAANEPLEVNKKREKHTSRGTNDPIRPTIPFHRTENRAKITTRSDRDIEQIQQTTQTTINTVADTQNDQGYQLMWNNFVKEATLKDFNRANIPPCQRPESCNNDLELGSFRPSRYTWDGEQRRGIFCHIAESSSIIDHVDKEMDLEFFLSKEVPLPSEVGQSLKMIVGANPIQIKQFWHDQILRVERIAQQAEHTQKQWDLLTPKELRNSRSPIKTVAILDLMNQYGLGGKRWMSQFTFGFPIRGDIEQTGVFPRDKSVLGAPPIGPIWNENEARFRLRARASGALNAASLWEEATDQVRKGWLGPPSRWT